MENSLFIFFVPGYNTYPLAMSVLEEGGPVGVEGLERPPFPLSDWLPAIPLFPLFLRSLARTAFFKRSS